MTKKTSHSEEQAAAQYESIAEMVAALDATGDPDDSGNIDYLNADKAREAIQENPLEITVRSDWYAPGKDAGKPAEFCILLCTGGPAVRIIGRLSEHGEPESARIEHQDWGTPWTEWRMTGEQETTVLAYCREFWFCD